MISPTLSLTHVTETGKTDETVIVTNSDFLRTVFGGATAEIRPVLVSFEGNPGSVSKSAWFGRPWTDGDPDLPFEKNNYFSLATFRPDDSGSYRRKKTQFKALHVILLDDIGTKIPTERITLEPTWKLETSPGNFQIGYLLSEPLTDGVVADRLMQAIVAAELCDPGANGPRARLARLPVGTNGKYDPAFEGCMRAWSPDIRYSVKELILGLQIELKNKNKELDKVEKRRSLYTPPEDGDPIWIPRADENVVLTALRSQRMYKTPLGEGKHDISCPWVKEHSGGVDSGTAYFEPSATWPIGGFKCLHGHCSDRHIRDLLTTLGVDIHAARMKSIIRVVSGEMNQIVVAAEQELARAKQYYQRGGLITTIVTDPETRNTSIQDTNLHSLVRALAGVATWERYDMRVKDWMRIDPPIRHATVLFNSTSYPHLPVLSGLTRQPYLRANGSLMTSSGYDPESCIFGVFDTRGFCVSASPSRKEAELALAKLGELLAEFSFLKTTDLAAALTAILTAAIRPSLAHAPMFHVRAPMIGSGKSFLCELITAFATPQRSSPMAFPCKDEECQKLLLASLLRAPAVIEFDNLTGDLIPHKSLCTVLTSEYLSDRILGVSKTATVGTRTLFLSSGNNVGPVKDMARRCIVIRLSPKCEIPAARSFKRPNLIREVLQQRGTYVSAALTIIRAWIIAGRPETKCRPLAGYMDWTELCRQPLLWLGCEDPAASVFESMAEDPEKETLVRFLDAWYKLLGKTPTMIRDAVKRCSYSGEASDELREVLFDIAGERNEINRRKLGRWIRRHSERIVNGKRVIRTNSNSSSEQWRVEIVEPVSSVLEV